MEIRPRHARPLERSVRALGVGGVILALVWATAGGARAEGTPAAGAPASSSGAVAPVDEASRTELDAWLARLTSPDAAIRKAAVAAIDAAVPALLPPIVKRLAEFKRAANRDGMSAVLGKPRKGGAKGNDGDVFERVMGSANPADADWRDLASILGLSRMLAHIGTLPAVRELAGLYPAFGDLLRVDVEHQLKALGERAVATLIELRRGETKSLRPWAAKMLDVLGKTVPGEAVQTTDNQVLADVLRAYGRIRDTDAARVIVSFANSDRVQVREAARDAVNSLAENGLWQLRESYENLVGKKAPEDWNWEKVASELFQAYDRARLAEVYGLMDEGLAAQKAGKIEAATSAFDRVLARAPMFTRRREMVAAYLDLARALRETDRPRAMATLRKAIRVDPGGARAKEAEGELAYLEAIDLAIHGVVDESAYRRAVDLDPANSAAREALARITARSEHLSSQTLRYGVAGALFLMALVGTAWALMWRRSVAT